MIPISLDKGLEHHQPHHRAGNLDARPTIALHHIIFDGAIDIARSIIGIAAAQVANPGAGVVAEGALADIHVLVRPAVVQPITGGAPCDKAQITKRGNS